MKEYRIYIDGKLVNVCHNAYAFMCNLTSYKKSSENVTYKEFDSVVNDKEKSEWLESLNEEK